MEKDWGQELLVRGKQFLRRELQKVDRRVTRDWQTLDDEPLIHPMLDIIDGEGNSHVMLCASLPKEAQARADEIALAIATVEGSRAFLFLYDAWVTTVNNKTQVRSRSEALIACVQTREGFVACMAAYYQRRPWVFEAPAPLASPMMLIQVPTWPAPVTH